MRVLNPAADAVVPDVRPKTGVLDKFIGLRMQGEGRALFSFSRPTRSPVDMLLVPRPLDIAFLDEEFRVMEIHGAHPVTTDPATWRLYRPDRPYRYALEVEAGLLPSLGFAEGHRLRLLD
ncbi:MAG: DUF192 domain-containing protein [Candidatus Nanohaloarchaea archaeon]|nr:DUF192 domain-containing protein [Candidatus Nanohaloarchaea archaeon]